MRPARLLIAGLIAEALLLALSSTDDPRGEEGKALFARRCSGCHASDINKEGPRLRGIYGARAASVPDFAYSDSLRKLNLNWDNTNLDRWLSDPDAIAPDTDMTFRLSSSDERKAVIAYLKTLGTR